jgi:adenosylcobinamide-GDP ribazoletransferase
VTPWLAAVRGALGFLTRLPVSHHDDDWAAFRRTPVAFPLVGYLVGALVALPLLAAGTLPPPTVALGYVLAVYAVTGIHHVDGVADFGDAAVVHGDAERRREVLKDTTTGVGALLSVSVVVVALALAGIGLSGLPILTAVAVAIAAEVGAKLGMAALTCFGTASHTGMAEQFTTASNPASFAMPVAVSLPVAAFTWPQSAAALALFGSLAGTALPWYWATRHLGGVNGDVLGAANEIGRIVGLHLGVIAWTLW